ncbi:MAG: FliA/WhiG family RNA polymerase sigma factor [Eubacteriales bacterium]|nr:FliA/WhiG family RNA polymerase sigma factor [Eubacteriales bacterium]
MSVGNINVEELWKKYTEEKTLEIKNELVLRYTPRVKAIVLRMMPTYQGYCNYDDMLSCGILGLMDAIEKFDVSRDVKFEHYATMRIKGEVIDNIRKQDWAPSSLRRKIKEIGNAYSELESKLFREPTDGEVAQHLDMDEEELHKTLGKAQMFNIIHFEEMIQDEFSTEISIQDPGESLETQIEKKEVVEILGSLIDKLPEKEKLVITLYYYEEMTLKEIAGVLGVSESRTSQIHSKAVMKLRTKMQFAYNR